MKCSDDFSCINKPLCFRWGLYFLHLDAFSHNLILNCQAAIRQKGRVRSAQVRSRQSPIRPIRKVPAFCFPKAPPKPTARFRPSASTMPTLIPAAISCPMQVRRYDYYLSVSGFMHFAVHQENHYRARCLLLRSLFRVGTGSPCFPRCRCTQPPAHGLDSYRNQILGGNRNIKPCASWLSSGYSCFVDSGASYPNAGNQSDSSKRSWQLRRR